MIDWQKSNLELRRRRDEIDADAKKREQAAEAQRQFQQHRRDAPSNAAR